MSRTIRTLLWPQRKQRKYFETVDTITNKSLQWTRNIYCLLSKNVRVVLCWFVSQTYLITECMRMQECPVSGINSKPEFYMGHLFCSCYRKKKVLSKFQQEATKWTRGSKIGKKLIHEKTMRWAYNFLLTKNVTYRTRVT